MAATQSNSDERLPTGRLIAHSSLHIPVTTVHVPIGVYLPAIYATQYGLSLTTLGMIFLAERIWGTLSDPIVGWMCDKTSSRFGKRKIWIAAGSVLYTISAWFLFFPGPGVTPAYLAVALVAVFFALSMMQIPYYAWSGELTPNYHERTRVTSYQTVASGLALFVVLLLPTIAEQIDAGDQVLKLNAMGLAIVIPAIPAALLAMWAFEDRSKGAKPKKTVRQRIKVGEMMRTVMAERLLFRIFLSDFAITFAQGIRGVLFVFFVSHVAGLPHMASSLFLLQFLFGIIAAPIWQAIARRIGKHQAVIAAEIGQAVVNFALLLVSQGDVVLLVALTVAQGLMQSTGNLILRAMLADVADEHRLRTGVDRNALLFSIFSISAKAGAALPVGIALPLVAWFGFDPAAEIIPSSGLLAVALVFALGPGLAHVVAAWLVRGFNIDESRQAEIRAQLEAVQSPVSD